MKILLTGKIGQVGWELNHMLSKTDTVFAMGRDRMDLSKPETLGSIIQEVRPDIIREQALPGLRVAGVLKETISDAVMLNKKSVMLRNLIDKALASITDEERRFISQRWLPGLSTSKNKESTDTIELSAKEIEFIASGHILRFSEVPWEPLSIIDDSGNFNGLIVDYMNIVSQKTGVQMLS